MYILKCSGHMSNYRRVHVILYSWRLYIFVVYAFRMFTLSLIVLNVKFPNQIYSWTRLCARTAKLRLTHHWSIHSCQLLTSNIWLSTPGDWLDIMSCRVKVGIHPHTNRLMMHASKTLLSMCLKDHFTVSTKEYCYCDLNIMMTHFDNKIKNWLQVHYQSFIH